MWRSQADACRLSEGEGPFAESAWPTVVVMPAAVVVVVPVVGLGLPWLSFEAVAAAAAVAMPANASRSPQARMERRNAVYLPVDCKSEAERAGYAPALGRASAAWPPAFQP
jgi:hypothetical protein